MKRVVVGISGGVDSSVAAMLLRDEGWDVLGVFMKNWEEEGGECPAEADAADARAACDKLGIPFYAVNLSKTYYDRVFSAFVRDVEAGLTPNPDVMCNVEVKFGAFLDFALKADAQALATGHFARVRGEAGSRELLRGIDGGKDQSYFLSRLSQGQLARAVFPVGHLTKRQVRELARQAGLPTAEKRDSTGICFIGERRFREFLAGYVAMRPGDIVDDSGRRIGRHGGVAGYTLGQRNGLGIGGGFSERAEPWFVIGKDVAGNRLIAAHGDHPALWSERLTARDIHWIGDAPEEGECLTAKIRYRQPDQACRVVLLDEGCAEIVFEQPQRAATPGQHVVLYRGEVCLGGGIIDRTVPVDAQAAASAASRR